MTHNSDPVRVGIGERLYASRFYCPILAAGANEVLNVSLQLSGDMERNMIELMYDQYPSLQTSDINVIIEL